MPVENQDKKILFDISSKSFLKLVIFLLLMGFLFLVRDLLLMIFVAIVIASGLDPLIDFLQKRKIPRSISLLFVYALLLALFVVIIYVLFPPIVEQFQQLLIVLPDYYDMVFESLGRSFAPFEESIGDVENISKSLTGKAGEYISNIYGYLTGFFGGLISIIIIFVLSFYFTVEENNFKKFIKSITPIKHRPYVIDLMDRIQKQIGLWLRGQLTLGLIVGVLIFIGLSILDIKYALILALLAALFEIVPYIGPIIAAVPAVFLAFTQSPLLGLLTIGLYIIVQQLENHFLVPKVMGKTVGLNPLIIILVILVGTQLAGIIGAILAVPIATAIQVFLKDIFDIKDARETAELQKQLCPVEKFATEGLSEEEVKNRMKLQKIICPIDKQPKSDQNKEV